VSDYLPILLLLGVVVFMSITLLSKGGSNGSDGKAKATSKRNKGSYGIGVKIIGNIVKGWFRRKVEGSRRRAKEKVDVPSKPHDPAFLPTDETGPVEKTNDPKIIEKDLYEPVFPDRQNAHEMLTDYRQLRRYVEMMMIELDDFENSMFWQNKADEIIRTGRTNLLDLAPMVQKSFKRIRDFMEEYRA
jgi:hypothetical protein